jgi:ribosomal protein S18 acetylase RimI-like enzyme
VEQFICAAALEHALESPSFRLLVVYEGERLVAIAGHLAESLLAGDGHTFAAIDTTRLQVLALSLDDQGRRLPDGPRVSDLVLTTLMHDALAGRDAVVLTAIVARENLRCLALLERHGLRSQTEYDAFYVRVSGHFTRRD